MRLETIKNIGLIILAALVIGLFILLNGVKQTPGIPRIAVVQDKPQEWADALKLGFDDGLREEGFEAGKNVVIIHRSAAGDPQGLTNLAEAVARQDFAIVYSLGTQASQEIFRAIKNKPIIFGAVTDPVAVGFYSKSLSNPLRNITGSQDVWPYPAQFDLMKRLIPNLKKLGIIYNSSEINSQVSVDFIKHECNTRNILLVERTVTDESQISLASAALLDENIDALFIPADNTAQTSSQVIIAACMKKKVPVFTGISGIVEHGALGTVGTNYYELGKVNAAQAVQILRGKQARNIPVAIANKGDIYLNLATAGNLGISIPQEIIDKAVKTYK
jgi:putative ABC transport system substrate-binding protein